MPIAYTTLAECARPAWHYLHVWSLGVSLGNPREKGDAYRFLESMASTFVCPECAHHFIQHIKSTNLHRRLVENSAPTIVTNEDLFKWTWEFHNAVNLRVGKPVVPYGRALQLYARGYVAIEDPVEVAATVTSTSPHRTWLLVAALLATAIYYRYRSART